ncbi:DHA2 family efflux MFS transporter permease subunit [Enhygromyxa salina]|uniref:Multidrug export protein EmrB n=1 Tax=Enhygromyxa salina TaxID=215803 RepID=A0A2S9XTK3_9BACT|nr:DHA2 family efflux MFS transporter permease subunit [Enhygromyxa salina]PRP96051.1 Multidrug export protein EmrB [Enhygromyxa salina]
MHQRTRPAATQPGIPAQTWKIAAVTGAGALMAMLDSTVANLALESVRADFAVTLSLVQWVSSGYLIALTVSLPATAWLASRYGYGRVWRAALAAFVLTSASCGAAPDPLTLIAARFVQGLAAGLMIPAGQAVLGSVAKPNQLGRLMGTIGLVVALGPAVGPAVGGVILEFVSWRWLFWINIPFGVAALVAARGLVPVGSTDADRRLDRGGLAMLGLGLPLLLFGAAEAASTGATTTAVTAIVVGGVMIVGFVFVTLDASHPLIDLRLLRCKTFAAATATTGLTGANMYGGLLILPLYLQLVAERSLAETGLILLAMGLGSALILPVAGSLSDRLGAGQVSLVGVGLLVITTTPLLAPQPPSRGLLTLLLVARGMGLALAQMPAMTAAYASVSAERMGDAATLVNIVQRLGGALGAIGLAVAVAHGGGSFTSAFILLTAIGALTLVPAANMRPRR